MITSEQEAQQVVIRHIGGMAWPTLLLLVSCASVYLACVWYLLSEPAFSWWVLAGISVCSYAIYTPVHDAVHGAVTGMSVERRWINEWTGYVAAHVLGISFTAHRRSHLKHHRSTNHPSEDPDMVFSAHSITELVAAWLKGVPKEWFFAASFAHFTDAEKVILRREVAAIFLTRFLIVLLSADFGIALVSLLLGQVIGNAVLVTLFAWAVHHPHSEQERMKTTTVYQARTGLDTLMTWLWGYQNYHAIHHLYPKVPFFRYRMLYRELEGYLRSSGVPVRQLI
ncbi:MAG: fatty acid desaturase [Luminiphilus sp.]|nr:fatty acid desaturase [Luminiphilus sp.]